VSPGLGSFEGGGLQVEVPKNAAQNLGIADGTKLLDCHNKLTLVNTKWDHWTQDFQLVNDQKGRKGRRFAIVVYTPYKSTYIKRDDPVMQCAQWHCFNPFGAWPLLPSQPQPIPNIQG